MYARVKSGGQEATHASSLMSGSTPDPAWQQSPAPAEPAQQPTSSLLTHQVLANITCWPHLGASPHRLPNTSSQTSTVLQVTDSPLDTPTSVQEEGDRSSLSLECQVGNGTRTGCLETQECQRKARGQLSRPPQRERG